MTVSPVKPFMLSPSRYVPSLPSFARYPLVCRVTLLGRLVVRIARLVLVTRPLLGFLLPFRV